MRLWIMCLFFFSTAAACAAEERAPVPSNFSAPSELPNTRREMKTAGFWISHHASPDTVVLTPEKITAFNLHIQNEQKLTKDIFNIIAAFKTESLIDDMEKGFKAIKDKAHYDAQGIKGNDDLLDKIYRNINFPGMVMGVAPRYGLIVRYADQRFFPASEGLYAQARDFDFDELQNSSLDVGTSVAIVHQSLDKQWLFVLSSASNGWVKAENVAVGDMKLVQEYSAASAFVVATAPKADMFSDVDKTQWLEHARMGARFPLVDILSEDTFEVKVPSRGKDGQLVFVSGYMDADQVHEGYLPFTPRTIIKQAFRLLNSPYGWGGMYGEQDCSAFLQEIFATVGVHLPRDSKDQALVGRELNVFDEKVPEKDKIDPLTKATAGITILPMKGHIMLYLGMLDGRPYVIQEMWAFRQEGGEKDIVRVINRAVVSDLSLGQGSQKGSLLRRLSAIREVRE